MRKIQFAAMIVWVLTIVIMGLVGEFFTAALVLMAGMPLLMILEDLITDIEIGA